MIYKYSQLTNRVSYHESVKNFDKDAYILHLGQLKLMMTDTFFLSKYYLDNIICVVVGAAEGGHFKKLSELFPKVIFHLYDPRKFKVVPTEKIWIFNQLFTDKEANIYKEYNGNILFISDIRTGTEDVWTSENGIKPEFNPDWEANVEENMKMQKNWVDIIKPIAASLKFRLPYNKKYFSYYDSDIIIQQFGPYSTEGRMFVSDYSKTKVYDCKEYDEKFAYFNMKYRDIRKKYTKFEQQLKVYNLKPTYDTTISCEMLKVYLSALNKQPSTENSVALFNDIVKFLQSIYNREKYNPLYFKKYK